MPKAKTPRTRTVELTDHHVDIIIDMCDLTLKSGGMNNLVPVTEIAHALNVPIFEELGIPIEKSKNERGKKSKT